MASKERRYVAIMDNGHETFEFRYTSTHRANSYQNVHDATVAHIKRTGCRASVVKTFLDYKDA